MKGKLGWPACDGDQVIGGQRQSRDHRMSVQMYASMSCNHKRDRLRSDGVSTAEPATEDLISPNYSVRWLAS